MTTNETPTLRGRTAVITGGGGDIGSHMAAELVRRGAHVVLLDRKSPAEAEPWISVVREEGSDYEYVEADTTDRRWIEEVLGGLDRLDIAIGNAGVGTSRPFLEIDDEFWQETLDVNLTGCFIFGQTAARVMVAQGRPGRIVFTGSWVQEVPWPEITAYSVSKAAVRMLARQMARELAPHGILVNIVAPGIVDAGLAKKLRETDETYARAVKKVIPLGDLQTPQQVAKATAFLCSDDAGYMTGAVLLVDGGCSLFKFE